MENTKLTDAKKALKKEVFSDIPKEELLAVSKEELVGFVESQWSALTARIALLAGSLRVEEELKKEGAQSFAEYLLAD